MKEIFGMFESKKKDRRTEKREILKDRETERQRETEERKTERNKQ